MIAIIDYGVGNLRSVEKAFAAVGCEATISSDADLLRRADKLILPGVGAFGDAMKGLRAFGFDDVVREAVSANRPILGLCVGLQMMFDEGIEFGRHAGLGLMPGRVVRFPASVQPVPHIGWNQIEIAQSHPLFKGLPNNAYFYFVHSYYIEASEPSDVLGRTEYGISYPSVCGRGNVFGVQFHPEKSQSNGLAILRNFAELESA